MSLRLYLFVSHALFADVGLGRFCVPKSISIVFIVVCDDFEDLFGARES